MRVDTGRAGGPATGQARARAGRRAHARAKATFAVGVVAVAVVWARPARAKETLDDVETDHVAAFDDGGPRSGGVLVDVPTLASAMLGAELDVAFSERVVLGIDGGARWLAGTRAYRASVGVLFFPQRFAFHGIYLHPFGQWGAAMGDPPPGAPPKTSFGGGATLGYAWTWPFGATVRFGAGAVYAQREFGGDATGLSADGVRPRVDGAMGWVF